MNTIHATRDVLLYASQYLQGDVLDAGGGTAKYKSIILTTAKAYTCLDAIAGDTVDVVGSVLEMPFQDSSFDTVVCNQVLEHVSEPEHLMSEIYRVLRSGGHAIITAPFMQPIHNDPGDFFRYTPEGMAALTQRHSFVVIEKGGYGGIWAVFSSFLKFIFFDPYKKQLRIKKALFRRIDKLLLWFDCLTHPRRIFSDSYIILKKL